MSRYRLSYIRDNGERGTIQTDEPAERGAWFFGPFDSGVTVTKCVQIADPTSFAPVRPIDSIWADAMRKAKIISRGDTV